MENESVLTGCYLLIVLSEPICEDHKEKILQRVAKGLLSLYLLNVLYIKCIKNCIKKMSFECFKCFIDCVENRYKTYPSIVY